MGLVGLVVIAVWVMLPAYIPNNVAVVAGGGRPVDGGRVWRGRRVLGDGKTWRGTTVGVLAGVLAAGGLNLIQPGFVGVTGAEVPSFPWVAVVSLPVGAMAGDMAASFVKRRTGRARGVSFPVVDQLDFVVGALVVTAVAAPGWFVATFTLPVILVIVLITPVLHVGTNAIGYSLGLKQEPW